MPKAFSETEGKIKVEVSKGIEYKLELEGKLQDIVDLAIKGLNDYKQKLEKPYL
jgi:hypothetical protein